MIRTALAFVKKDFLIEISYRFNFFLKTAFILLAVVIFYYIGKFVDSASVPILQSYGGSYFGFLLIGITFADYVGISINSFASNIRDGQLTGTLEIILTSPTRLTLFLFSSSLWIYIFTTFRIFLYLAIGVFMFGLDLENADVLAAIIIFILSIISYIAIGIMSASLVLVVKRGESVFNAFGGLLLILGGVLFPMEVFPSWVKTLSTFIPFTYSMHGLRLALLEGHSIEALKSDIVALLIFAVLFWVICLWSFPYAVRRAKIRGTLTQY